MLKNINIKDVEVAVGLLCLEKAGVKNSDNQTPTWMINYAKTYLGVDISHLVAHLYITNILNVEYLETMCFTVMRNLK
jgi:hypothetical protein